LKLASPLINAMHDALYNFLSTFTGTHFVTPRTFQVSVGVNF